MYGSSYGQDDYEVGDKIVVQTESTKQVVRVEEKSDDVKRGKSGWEGEVVEVLNVKPGARREEGDMMWGYDRQIEHVR